MKVLLLLILSTISTNYAANILILEGSGSPSHHLWIRAIMDELMLQEHNITSITAIWDNVQLPNIHYITLDEFNKANQENPFMNFTELELLNPWQRVTYYADRVIIGCQAIVKSAGYKKLMDYPDEFEFDLILYDHSYQPCLLPFYTRFDKPRMIALSPQGYHSVKRFYGLYTPFEPHVFYHDFKPSFAGRVENFLLYTYEYLLKLYYVYPKLEVILDDYIDKGTTLSAIENKADLVFANTQPVLETPESVPANVIPVGGLHVREARAMSKDLQKIADEAINGIVVVSFGNDIDYDFIGNAKIQAMINSFQTFQLLTFFWNIEPKRLTNFQRLPSNVIARGWLPQQDLLAHKHTILLISNGGALSLQEAIWNAVPVLGIPVFGDQYSNLKYLADKGAAKIVPFTEMKEKTFKIGIRDTTSYLKYERSAIVLSKIFHDQPQKPIERAMFWINWTLRFANHTDIIRSHVLDYNVFEKQNIDIIAFLSLSPVIILLGIVILLRVICFCIQKLFGNVQKLLFIRKASSPSEKKTPEKSSNQKDLGNKVVESESKLSKKKKN